MKRSTLILLLVAVALGGVVFFIQKRDKERNTSRDSDEATSKPAFNFKREDVAAVSITRGDQTVKLENQSGKWQIVEPVKADADESAVEGVIGEVTGATVDRTLVMTPSLQHGSGLDKPAVLLEVKLKGGAQHRIALGRQDPTGANVYAQLDQNKDVALVSPTLLSGTNKSLSDLRDKALIKANLDELTRVQVKNPNGKLVVEKDKDGKWLIAEPADRKGKEAKTDKLFTFEHARATEVIDNAPADVTAKLAHPAVEVQITDKGGKTTALQISAADGDNIFARVEGRSVIYKVSKQVLEDLSFTLADVAP